MKVSILGKNELEVVNLNRRRAIRERCLNCSEWSFNRVLSCTFTDCPLFPYRLGRGKQNAKDRAKRIRAYCKWRVNDQRNEIAKCPNQDCSLWPYRKVITDRSAEIKTYSDTKKRPYRGHLGGEMGKGI